MARAAQIRRQLSGAATVSGGLALLGLAAYAFLALAGHALAPHDYAAVASLYFLTAIVGPGLFVAVEQEANREVSSRIAAGSGTAPVMKAAWLVSAGLAVLVMLVLLVLSPVLVREVFGGSWPLLVAAVVSVGGAAAVYVLRGAFAGQRRYGWYSATLAAEGLARLVPCVALVLMGIADPTTFGYVFALGTAVAAAATVAGGRVGAPGPAVSRSGMARGVGLLACASGLTLLVANLAPVVVTSRLTDDPRVAASFASLFILARTPLFLFAPVQALLLPRLVGAAAIGDAGTVRRQVGTVLAAVAAVGLPGTVFAALLGPWAARVFFDAPTDLSMVLAGLLGLSTAAMMAAQVLQSALVALRVHRMTTVAWIIGTLIFVTLLFMPIDPVVAAVVAQLVAPFVVVSIMAVAMHRALRTLTSDTEVPASASS
ncbi:polysaccharide biosynthesis protein [Pseudonocardia artemisiae]